MKKNILSFFVGLTVITGCVMNNSTDSDASKNQTISENKQQVFESLKKENYRDILLSVKNKQEQYISSLPKEAQSSVQTALSAMVNKATELQESNPLDKQLIEKIVSELSNPELTIKINEDAKYIDSIIKKYSEKVKTTYLECTPASNKNYYGLATPDQVLNNSYLDGKQIAFKITESYQLGKGELFLLNGCYVNETGTELILFVEKGNTQLVLQTSKQPLEGNVVLSLSIDNILNEYTNK